MNDLISRSALLADLQEYLNQEVQSDMTITDMGEGIDLAMERVKNSPAVDAEPVRHRRWLPVIVSSGKPAVLSLRRKDGRRCKECG